MKIKTIINVSTSLIRNMILKIINGSNYQCNWLYSCPISSSFNLNKKGVLKIGKHLSARRNLSIIVRENAVLNIGDSVNFNDNCSITCRKNISIGNNVIFGPGCMVFDHDHDYHKIGVERRKNLVDGDISIGNGVWFGANCIVLRNTHIGDNCVFGAGSIVKGEYQENSKVIQERKEQIHFL